MTTPLRPPLTAEERLRRLTMRRLQREGLAPAPALPRLPPPPTVPRQPSDVTAAPITGLPTVERPPSLAPATPPVTLEERLRALPLVGSRYATMAEEALGIPGGREHQTMEERGLAAEPAPARLATGVANLGTDIALASRVPGLRAAMGPIREAVPLATEGLDVAGRLARAAGRGARTFGTLGATESTLRREPPGQILEHGLTQAAGGAVFGGGEQALAEGLGALRRGIILRGLARDAAQAAPQLPDEAALERIPERLRLTAGGEPPPAGMPQHVAVAGQAQRVALELTDREAALAQTPPFEESFAGKQARQAVPPTPTPEAFARTIRPEAATNVPQEAPRPLPTLERPPAAPAPDLEMRLPPGTPEVLGGTAAEYEAQRPKIGQPGVLPEAPAGVRVAEERIPPTAGAQAGAAAGQPFETVQLKKPLAQYSTDELDQLRAGIQMRRDSAAQGLARGEVVGSTQPFDYDLQLLRDELATRRPAKPAVAPTPARALPALGPGGHFYSRLERAVQTAPFEKGTAQQWDVWFKKVPGGTSREELELSTVRPFLDELAQSGQLELGGGPRVISRTELLERFQPVGISEHVNAEATPRRAARREAYRQDQAIAEARYSEANRQFRELAIPEARIGQFNVQQQTNAINVIANLSAGVELTPTEVMRQLKHYEILPADADADHPIFRAAVAMNTAAAQQANVEQTIAPNEPQEGPEAGPPQYREYTLPGGTNYREIILTQPKMPAQAGFAPAKERVSRASVAYTDALDALRKQPNFPPPGRQTLNELLQYAAALSPGGSEAERYAEHVQQSAQRFLDAQRELQQATEAIPLQQEPYRSSHWAGIDNPVAHLRMTDREIGGKPAAFIEEIQSDVHQHGREEGYADPTRVPDLHSAYLRAGVEFSAYQDAVHRAIRTALRVDKPEFVTIPNPPWTPGHPAEVLQTHVRLGDAVVGELTLWPEAPSTRLGTHLVGDRGWVFNGLYGQVMNASTHTRNIDEALRNLRETFAGQQKAYSLLQMLLNESGLNKPPLEGLPGDTAVGQAFSALNRWRALEAQVEQTRSEWEAARSGPPKLALSRTEDWAGFAVRRAIDEAVRTGKEVLAWTTGEQQADRYDLARHVNQLSYYQHPDGSFDLNANRRGTNETLEVGSHIAPAKLDEYVGPEIADKIRAGVGTEATPGNVPGWKHIGGLDLHVGGSGMKKFYDDMLPKIVREQFKRLGAKVTPERQPLETGAGLTLAKVADAYDNDVRSHTNEEELLDRLQKVLDRTIRTTEEVIPDETWQSALEEARFELQDVEVADAMANLEIPAREANIEHYEEQAREELEGYAADRWGGAEMKVRRLLEERTNPVDRAPVWAVPVDAELAKTVMGHGQILMERSALDRLVEPSAWTEARGQVDETAAAYGTAKQLELNLAKTVDPMAYYAKRSATARRIVAQLQRGYANWVGRAFPGLELSRPTGDPELVVKYDRGYRDAINGVAAMLQAIRSPFTETLALFGVREGQIVASHILSSGVLNMVTTAAGHGKPDLLIAFLEEARAAGATDIWTGHNHPSGNPNPSSDDLSMWVYTHVQAQARGMEARHHLVIDDHSMAITHVRDATDGRFALEPRFLPYKQPRKFSWLTPPEPIFGEPVAAISHWAPVLSKLGRAHHGYLLHLNAQSVIVGIEPFAASDLQTIAQTGIPALVAGAGRKYGARWTAIAVSSHADFQRALAVIDQSPVLARLVGDVIFADPMMPGTVRSARMANAIDQGRQMVLEDQMLRTVFGHRVAEGQAGYTTDPVVLGSRPLTTPRGEADAGPRSFREAIGPLYGEDGLPNAAAVIAQQAIDASESLGLTASADGVIGKLLTSFAGTRMEQIGAPLHLVLTEYERQRTALEQLVHQDIVRESLDRSAVDFLAGLPYFNEFRAVSLLAWLRDKLPSALGKKFGVTPDRQAALFDAAEAITAFDERGQPVFRDVLERSGELDEQAYRALERQYGHPEQLALEVRQLDQQLEGVRKEAGRPSVALSPSAAAVERYRLKLRTKATVAKAEARQVVAQLRAEIAAHREELQALKATEQLHAREGILDEDAAAALPAERARIEGELKELRSRLEHFQGLAAGRTAPGGPIEPKDVPAAAQAIGDRLARWRTLRGQTMELEEVRRGRESALGAFRRAYEARAKGRQAGEVRVTAQDAEARWNALSRAEQNVVRRFTIDRERAHRAGLEAHLNRELAKFEYGISSDIEAYVHHYGFEDEGAMTLFFGSSLRRKKLLAGARLHRMGVEGFTRNLEGARLHGGIPLALQQLQNEFAEALERVMFTTPDPNLAQPLAGTAEPPEGYAAVTGRFGDFKGQRFAVANAVYKELEFFQRKPPAVPTTDAQANTVWRVVSNRVTRAIYFWSLNQLISLGTAARNFYGGATQYAAHTAELLAGGDLLGASRSLLNLARALAPKHVRAIPVTEFGASQQTLRTLDTAHGAFRALMNAALIPFGMVENYFKRALTLGARETMAQRIVGDMVAEGTIPKDQARQAAATLFRNPTFEMRAFEETVRDAFAYNYNNVPLALRRMNKTALGKALVPYPIWGYKFARQVGRYSGAAARLARGAGRPGDLQKVLAALLLFGIPAVLTWMGDEEGKAQAPDPGAGVKYDFDRSGRVYLTKNARGNEEWLLTRAYGFYGLGAVLGHTLHDLARPPKPGAPQLGQPLTHAQNYVADFFSVGPGFQAADYVRGVRNRYQTYRNNAAIAADMARSFIPFHRPLEAVTRLVDPTKRKQETFLESLLQTVPVPERALEQVGLSRGQPRTGPGGQLVPAYDPWLEFLKEFAGVNIKEIDPVQAQREYRIAAARAQARGQRTEQQNRRLQILEERRRTREHQEAP